ncbi:MAG TPA: VWA domain-containing protein [Pyrinomonadaceae bacterium]|nr:VWA domain-containing protein [Pyrinomonadaceae bacterium]
MNPRCLTLPAILFIAVLCCASVCAAQTKSPSPSPSPTPPTGESPDKVKIFTEEVVIPVNAYDDSGHLSVALEPQAIIVFEDDVRQTVRSIRRIPANVLLLLDTGGALNPAMTVSTTKEISTRLISNLRTGDHVAAMQFGNHLESISDWTTEREQLIRAINTKLISGDRPQLIKALVAAAARLQEVPAGTRHLVLITDGVDASGDATALTAAIKQLLDANVTIHVIGYGTLGRKKIDKQNPQVKITNKKRRSAQDIAEDLMDPAGAARREIERRKKIYVIFDTDFAMRKQRGAYEDATKKSELWLRSLAEETGGMAFIPEHLEEMSAGADEIAREIDSQYVVTYTPKRPLAEATVEEYRRLNVAAGIVGLHVRARRGYVARAQ